MKPTYEETIDFIENKIGCRLFEYQKEFIKRSYDNQYLYLTDLGLLRRYELRYVKRLIEILFKEN